MELIQKIAEIKSKNDIVDIVGKYVELKRSGINYKGLCPFHDDHNPSLIVSPEKQIVNCFVCLEKALDVIGFVQKIEKLSFSETIDKLYGKTYESDNFSLEKLEQRLSKINNKIKALDIVPLPNDCIELATIDKCPEYLLKRISFDIVKKFKLKKTADRIIIPIYEEGEYKGFIGRDYTGKSSLSHLIPSNWNIGKYFFNLDSIDPNKKVIIVEGTFDVMYLIEKKYTNVVSILGTKLNIYRIEKLLKKGVKDIILCLDMDKDTEAGQEATKKIINKVKNIFNVYTAELLIGRDVDECSEEGLFRIFSNLKSFTLTKIIL